MAGRSPGLAAAPASAVPIGAVKKPLEAAGQPLLSPKNPLGDRNASPGQEVAHPATPRVDHAAYGSQHSVVSPAVAAVRDGSADVSFNSPRESPRGTQSDSVSPTAISTTTPTRVDAAGQSCRAFLCRLPPKRGTFV